MRLGVLFSGGKDSVYAACRAHEAGHTLTCAITVQPTATDSQLFHTPNLHAVEQQVNAMEVPWIPYTPGEEETEYEALEAAIQRALETESIDGIVTGAVASVYQATRVQRICYSHSLWCINPLWQTAVHSYMAQLVRECQVIITAVAAEGLDSSWLGCELTEDRLAILHSLGKKYGVHLSGEGGEYETFVTNAPLFSRPLHIHKATASYDGMAGRYTIHEIAEEVS